MIRFRRTTYTSTPGIAIFLLLCSVLCVTNSLATVTVPGDYPTIQAALDDLKNGPLPDGEIIEVLPGIYHEAVTYAEASKSFTLRSVAGAEQTTIDSSGTDRSTIYIRDTAATILIDGFTITGGNTRDGGGLNFWNASATLKNSIIEDNYGYHGGGMQLNASNSSIENCIFQNNIASKSGGAITVVSGSLVTILDSKILDNIAGAIDPIANGGGIRVGNSSVIIQRSEISGNNAKFAGGGIFAIGEFDSPFGVTSLTLQDSLVSGNSVIHDQGNLNGAGGGVHIEANTQAFINNSVIVDNISSGKGGGLNTFQASYQVLDSLIEYNQALEGSGGGVQGFSYPPSAASIVISDSVIRNNTALNAGGISIDGNECGAGGVCATLEINRVLVDKNYSSFFGGGINVTGATASILDSQVLRNSVTDIDLGTGGGLRVTALTLNILNTSIAGNTASVSGGGIYIGAESNINVDSSFIYANFIDKEDKGGGVHTSSAGPPTGTIQNTIIAKNSGFQIREQSCPPELPSPILSYFNNNISNKPLDTLYQSPCYPPAEIFDIDLFNSLSPGLKTDGNYDTDPSFSVFSGIPLPQGGSALAWTQVDTSTVEILNLGSFAGPVGAVDILPACTSTYWMESTPVTVLGTGATQLHIAEQNLRGNKIIEATNTIRAEKTNVTQGADVTLKAGNTISFSTQFAVESGGILHIQIEETSCVETR